MAQSPWIICLKIDLWMTHWDQIPNIRPTDDAHQMVQYSILTKDQSSDFPYVKPIDFKVRHCQLPELEVRQLDLRPA